MADYPKLAVWEKSHALTLAVYRLSASFPLSERYGLTSQLRRAASSIPMNIAEGSGRSTDKDYARFVSNAIGSANEVEYQLCLVRDLKLGEEHEIESMRSRAAEVRRMLVALRRTLSDAS